MTSTYFHPSSCLLVNPLTHEIVCRISQSTWTAVRVQPLIRVENNFCSCHHAGLFISATFRRMRYQALWILDLQPVVLVLDKAPVGYWRLSHLSEQLHVQFICVIEIITNSWIINWHPHLATLICRLLSRAVFVALVYSFFLPISVFVYLSQIRCSTNKYESRPTPGICF